MQLFFILHLLGGLVVGVFILLAFWAILRKQTTRYTFYAKSIAFTGAYQLITGCLLALTTEGTIFAFCARIGLYSLMLFITELALFFVMKKVRLSFPTAQVSFAYCVSLSFVILTIVEKMIR